MRVHILQHVPFEGPGSIASWLERRRAEVTCTRFYQRPDLPDPATLDLLVVLGGPMSVNDEQTLPWLIAEKRFVGAAVSAGTAVLGICLGAQLIASALGARVYPGAEKEIGWFPVFAAEPPDGRFSFPAMLRVFHWHGETFDLPDGASLLASSPACRHQAFQFGERTIGLQFHLETTPASVETLVANCRHELVPGRFVQTEAELNAVDGQTYTAIHAHMERLLDYLTRPA
jgi:GMP synthase-like glutamine amidotransferase